MNRSVQEEVDRNYEAFQRLLPSIINQHRGKYALMKNGEIVGYYSSPIDARSAADLAFKGEMFSIQHVSDMSINLGFYTDAVLRVRV